MKRLVLLFVLLACSKKSSSASPPVASARPSTSVARSLAPPSCDVRVEMRTADVGAIPSAGIVGGVAGADTCAVHRQIEDRTTTDGVVVYDEETTPLRRGEDGCEQAGPPEHLWHAVDTRTKKEWIFAADLDVEVEPKEIVAKKAGCTEIRYSR